MIRRPPRSTLFPTRRSSDLAGAEGVWRQAGVREPEHPAPAHGLLHRAAVHGPAVPGEGAKDGIDRKSTRLNSSHANISYAVFCLKKKNQHSRIYYTYTTNIR